MTDDKVPNPGSLDAIMAGCPVHDPSQYSTPDVEVSE